MKSSRNCAADALIHYFETVFKAAGITWDLDNDAEVRGIVDDLIEAAKVQDNG